MLFNPYMDNFTDTYGFIHSMFEIHLGTGCIWLFIVLLVRHVEYGEVDGMVQGLFVVSYWFSVCFADAMEWLESKRFVRV